MNYINQLKKIVNPLKIAIVGYGFMGSMLYSQLKMLNGFDPFTVYGRDKNSLKTKFKNSSPILSDNIDEVVRSASDIIVDCTGDPNFGAELAYKALNSGKDVVSFNVETDSAVGPILNEIAKENNCVYSGILGDEPGAIIELYDYATLLGFEVLCVGKGKNNPLNIFANPDELESEAKNKGLSPYMLTSFVDGTNTMIELCNVGNAIGFTPDIPGCHGMQVNTENIAEMLSTEGVLKNEKVLEYVFGMSPGVFAIVKTDNPEMDYAMRFLKMGKGPNYLLYRPFHLTSIEVPMTLCRVYFEREPSIVQEKQINDVAAFAKKDLKPGDKMDSIGGYTSYGKLQIKEKGNIPIALIDENTEIIKPVKKGEQLTMDNIRLSESFIKKLRDKQDELGL